MKKTIAFHLNHMSERGTELSTFDYAFYNKKILGNNSIIIANRKKIFNSLEKFYLDSLKKFNLINDNNIKLFPKRQRSTYSKFAKNFDIFFYDDREEIDKICKLNNANYFYAQKYGNKDNVYSLNAKNLNHIVFMVNEPHGYKYLYISEWLAKRMTGNPKLCVPYIVNKQNFKCNDDLKKIYNISNDKLVIASYGGKRVFDINFVKKAIKKILEIREDMVFMFMNTEPFLRNKNIIYLDRTIDLEKKKKFINTCDYMIHARERGETFGLAVAEFSIQNKPVITYAASPEKAHLDILQDNCLKYSNYENWLTILKNLKKNDQALCNNFYKCYSRFNVENVMELFEKRFLN
jgi:hypothetical protein